MPKAFVVESGQTSPNPNCLANFAFISRADNRLLGGAAPSNYRKYMPIIATDILQRAMCPVELFDDDFPRFIELRVKTLTSAAKSLCEIAD